MVNQWKVSGDYDIPNTYNIWKNKTHIPNHQAENVRPFFKNHFFQSSGGVG